MFTNTMLFHNDAEERLYLTRAQQTYERLKDRYITASVPFAATVAVGDARPLFADRPRDGYKAVVEGDLWGMTWQTGWFHLDATVPEAWAGAEVVAWIEISGEGLLYTPEGVAMQGITHGSIFDNSASRPHASLFTACQGGERVELWLEAACNGLMGISPHDFRPPSDPNRLGTWHGYAHHLCLAAVDREVWALRLDLEVLLDLIKHLPAGSVRRARILAAVTRCCEVLARDERAYAVARAALAEVMAKRANASDLPVRAVGHAHIDTAWLWPQAETVRKVARTFANQLDLIARYPGYVFGASAPQHYAWMKASYPELYARVKQAVADGRWELQGGMWVEADCNLTSGESLVRQFLHGKNFFRDEFGQDVDNLWLPDVFGYAAALPQIMAKSGVTTFLTQKISWNQFNEFPFNTFWWQGLDGTRVLTHFPPENTYNSDLKPGSLMQAQERFKEKAVVDETMSLFGIGDGGGGPRADHLERAQRLADLEGCPPVRLGSAREFFANLRTSQDQLKTWVGELYLELHRGTLTTQAAVKRANRRLEHRLRELEMLWSAAPLAQYPIADFDAIWKELLTLQFHDIIPGSSIQVVYRETHAAHARLLAACDGLEARFASAHLAPEAGAVTWFNSLNQPWVGAVTLPDTFAGRGAQLADGTPLPTQVEDGASVALLTVPAQGWITVLPAGQPAKPPAATTTTLENALVRFTFAADGSLISAFEKSIGRELLAAPGNRLSLYHDRPCAWDAWDIDRFYKQEHITDARFTVEPLEAGPVRSRLRLRAQLGASTIAQVVTLAAGSRRLDFRTTVSWHEQHRMLRVAFPAQVATERVACEIQFGHLFRATHENTSWDMAKFEVPAHRFVDVSAADGGLALLNDSKYGHALHRNVLDLCLLRSPTSPDPDADQGEHTFTYSLLPHPGDLISGGVRDEAYRLNQPPVRFAGWRGAPSQPVTVTGDGVDIAALKRAERDTELVLRLIETRGLRSRAVVRLARPGSLVDSDLLEWHDGAATPVASEHHVELAPFEIRTCRIRHP